MSRALVSGGVGFLERALVERLVGDGTEVVVLDNLSSASPLSLPDSAEPMAGEVVEPPALLGPFEVLYHLASPASPRRYLQDPVGTLRSGAEGTRRVLDLAEEWGARFLFAVYLRSLWGSARAPSATPGRCRSPPRGPVMTGQAVRRGAALCV